MQPNIRVMLFDEDGERFFGEGPCRLLHAIEQTGSLRAAAQSMQMAYTRRSDSSVMPSRCSVLRSPSANRRQGRRRQRTYRRGKEFLYRYEQYRDACNRQETALSAVFPR